MAPPNEQKTLETLITSDFEKAADALDMIERANRARIPENLFKNVFLGLFANLENQHPDATIQNWISIAGNPFAQVDVVDNDGILFTVPAIYDKDAVNPAAMNRAEPLSHIVAIAQKLALRSPIEGQNYIANKYNATRETVRGKADVLSNIERWNVIFERYNLPELMALEKKQSATTPVPKSNQDDIKDELRGDDLEFTPI